MSLKEFVYFIQVVDSMGIKLLVTFFIILFNTYRICSDVPFSIPGIGNLCLLSFFLVRLTRDLSIRYNLFVEATLVSFAIFPVAFLFSVSLITVSFLLFALNLPPFLV